MYPPTSSPFSTDPHAIEQVLDPETRGFYRRSLHRLHNAGVQFLVGGAYAFERYTDIARHTKDLDVFLRKEDVPRALEALSTDGCAGEVVFPHWLAKSYCGEHFVDLIYGSGNGVAPVDEDWFTHAVEEVVLGVEVKIVPAEEMIWQKALIMERERFDGADVAHLIRARAEYLDWDRLLGRFGEHWRVLLSHLALFGYIYPESRARIPAKLMSSLLQRCAREAEAPPPADEPVCNGTVLSRTQYVVDLERWGYQDARVEPRGQMSADDAASWTEAGLEQAAT